MFCLNILLDLLLPKQIDNISTISPGPGYNAYSLDSLQTAGVTTILVFILFLFFSDHQYLDGAALYHGGIFKCSALCREGGAELPSTTGRCSYLTALFYQNTRGARFYY